MSGRVTGYHYVVGKDGRRHRVYGDDMHKKKKSYTSVPRAVRGPGILRFWIRKIYEEGRP